MGRIVIACYKPKPGKEDQLVALTKTHVPRLLKEGLVTNRQSIIMKASDGTLIEIFEWKSRDAIEQAHSNKEVQKMWSEFAEVCEYETPSNIKELGSIFSEFAPVN